MSCETIVILPAYEPPETFLTFTKDLLAASEHVQLIVVDDGSGEAYASRFREVGAQARVTLLSHRKNRGKGHALKSAFRYAAKHFPADTTYVCADCDGQHTVRDVLRVAQEGQRHPDALTLGCRSFSGDGIPLRSSLGNRITAALFTFLFGLRVRDTQTGLRAFGQRLLPLFIGIKGGGFEYEMRTLILCPLHHISVRCIDIETVYKKETEGCERISHFSPIADSLKILAVLFSSVAKYALASLVSTAVDMTAFYLLLGVFFSDVGRGYTLLLCTVGARLLSSGVHFLLNFKYVFKATSWTSLWKYYTVWLGRLAISYTLTLLISRLVSAPLPLTLWKTLADVLLAALGYRLLRSWVFAHEGTHTEAARTL